MEISLLKEIPNPRDKEEILLSLFVRVAAGEITSVNSPIEANIFRVSGSVILNNYPLEAQRFSTVAKEYFISFPEHCLHASQIVRNEWIISYPRLKDMLIQKINNFNYYKSRLLVY